MGVWVCERLGAGGLGVWACAWVHGTMDWERQGASPAVLMLGPPWHGAETAVIKTCTSSGTSTRANPSTSTRPAPATAPEPPRPSGTRAGKTPDAQTGYIVQGRPEHGRERGSRGSERLAIGAWRLFCCNLLPFRFQKRERDRSNLFLKSFGAWAGDPKRGSIQCRW